MMGQPISSNYFQSFSILGLEAEILTIKILEKFRKFLRFSAMPAFIYKPPPSQRQPTSAIRDCSPTDPKGKEGGCCYRQR
jgi:hypothetical protein